jgi:hypothetical protein
LTKTASEGKVEALKRLAPYVGKKTQVAKEQKSDKTILALERKVMEKYPLLAKLDHWDLRDDKKLCNDVIQMVNAIDGYMS